MKHTHKAIDAKSTDYGWTECITPRACAANPSRQVAHGNIIRQDVCACGATRQAEINGGRQNYGPWETVTPPIARKPAWSAADSENPRGSFRAREIEK